MSLLPETYRRSVSILIPNFNGASSLNKTLESCLDQQEFVKEIIVVDDQSTDDSWEILKDWQNRYPDLIQIYPNPRKGGNAGRNHAFEQSSGEYIQWLDADDQIFPNKLQTQLRLFESQRSVDIVYSDWQMDFWEYDKFIRSEKHPKSQEDDFLGSLLHDKWSPPHNYLFRRAIGEQLAEMNGWDEKYPVHQDTEYLLKAAAIGSKFAYQAGNFAVYNRNVTPSVSQRPLAFRKKYWFMINQMVRDIIRDRQDLSTQKQDYYQGLTYTNQLISSFYNQELALKEYFPYRLLRKELATRRLKYILSLLYFKEIILKIY